MLSWYNMNGFFLLIEWFTTSDRKGEVLLFTKTTWFSPPRRDVCAPCKRYRKFAIQDAHFLETCLCHETCLVGVVVCCTCVIPKDWQKPLLLLGNSKKETLFYQFVIILSFPLHPYIYIYIYIANTPPATTCHSIWINSSNRNVVDQIHWSGQLNRSHPVRPCLCLP